MFKSALDKKYCDKIIQKHEKHRIINIKLQKISNIYSDKLNNKDLIHSIDKILKANNLGSIHTLSENGDHEIENDCYYYPYNHHIK